MISPRRVQFGCIAAAVTLVRVKNPLSTAAAFSLLGYAITSYLIPLLGDSFIKAGLRGKDLLKKAPTQYIPEAMGIVPAVTYMVLLVAIIPFVFFKYLVSFLSMSNEEDLLELYSQQYHAADHADLFPHEKLAEYLSGALCLMCTILLGFFDDLFDIRWRHKFFLPAVASLPLLIVYYVNFSVTSVVVPLFLMQYLFGETFVELLAWVFGSVNSAITSFTGLKFTTLTADYELSPLEFPKLLDLGVCYYVYMSALSIFTPNSINILAGINGLEVGQSIVLAMIFLLNDFLYLFAPTVSSAAYDSHLLSAIFLIPFVGVSLALYQFNSYPARVFVGDTYCYFSGMVFAIVGILGHFSKTLLIFLLPQIINFVYSILQLFHILPCPRHRLPQFDASDDKMHPSFASIRKLRSPTKVALLKVLSLLRLLLLQLNDDGDIVAFSNMTIINLCLVWLGPMHEADLCRIILVVQFTIGALMIVFRHTVGPWLFGYDNLTWNVK